MSVRVTVTLGRVKGLPHRPETVVRGGRVMKSAPDWLAALDVVADVVEDAEREGRPVQSVTLLAEDIVARNSQWATAHPPTAR